MRKHRKRFLGLLCCPLLFIPLLAYISYTSSQNPVKSHMYSLSCSLRQLGATPSLAIFSVFLDRRVSDNQTEIRSYNGHINGVLRIILVKRRGFTPRLHCLFNDGTSVPTRDLRGKKFGFYELTENHQRLYGGYSVHCDVPPSVQLHKGVKIWLDGPEHSSVLLPVIHANATRFKMLPSQQTISRTEHQFTVCVPAMHHTKNLDADFLSDWFNVHMRLGVSKFRIYYIEPIYGALLNLIQSLRSKVEIDLYPLFWRENNRAVLQDSWYYLQTMTVNDCLLRSLYDTEFAFFGDLDEVLIPHSPEISNWSVLAKRIWVDSTLPGVCFPAFKFYGPGDSMRTSLERSVRADKLRSKCLVRPLAIFEMGIHHISKPYEEAFSGRPKISTNITYYAFIHHYHRLHTKMRLPDTKLRIMDRSLLRFMQT